MNCGKKRVGSSSTPTSMRKVWCDSSSTVSMNLFRFVLISIGHINETSNSNECQINSKQMSVQRIVEDSPAIELQAEAQHTSGEIETPVTKAFLIFK